MKNRFWMMTLIIALSLALGACADGTIPANLPKNLEGLESVEVEVSGEGSSASIDEIEVTGVVSMISADAWTIAGQNFLLTPDTEIKGSLEVADIAKVHAYLGESGEVFAREIEPAEDSDDSDSDDDSFDDEMTELEENGHEIEFVGLVESMGDTMWMIAGREVIVKPTTEVKGTIEAGVLVKIHASFFEGEGLVAREIEPAQADDPDEDDLDDDSDLKFEGYVDAIDEATVVVDGTTFHFSDFTEFEDEISVGDFVEIYFFDQDGQNIVREIELEDMDEDFADLDDDSDFDDDEDDDDDYDEDDEYDDDDDENDDDHDDEDQDEEDDD